MERGKGLARWVLVGLAAVLIALLVAGCGGGAAAKPGAAFPLANSLCHRLNVELASSTPRTASESIIARVAPQNAALEHAALKVFDKLTPPSRIAQEWQQILTYRRTLADELAALGEAEKKHDSKTSQALIGSKKHVHAELLALARRIDVPECGLTGLSQQ
jgi:hypothetical protein